MRIPSPRGCRLLITGLALFACCDLGFAQLRNIAGDGTASQSSEWNGGLFPAGNAIDGRVNTFSHTDSDTVDNHWRLSFDQEQAVETIEIVARQDCCGGRLSNAILRLFDDEGESVFDEVIADPGQGGTFIVALPEGTFARSLRIGFEAGETNDQGNLNLHLGEVRVFSDNSERLTIDSFTTTPAAISKGEFVELKWATTGASTVTIQGIGETSITGQVQAQPEQSTSYLLTATSESGSTTSASASVIVDGKLLPLAISEFMALPDPDTQERVEDWIEIHNPNPVPISLDGYGLTDTADHSAIWPFLGGTNIAANGFLIVEATGNEAAEMETDFRLAREAGSYLALITPDRTTVSAFTYPEQRKGVTFGIAANGTQQFFLTPTPAETNGTGHDGFVGDTRFSIDRGFYDTPFALEISTSTEAATILVTLDGTRPAPGTPSSFAYSQPLSVTSTSVVRAAAFRDGYLPSNIDTQTYIFIADVIRQPQQPEGFPVSWGDGPGVQTRLPAEADYAMDSRIVNAAPFTDLDGSAFDWNDAMRSVPTMSLVLPIDDLLDPETGLHANARSRGRAWEREASLEIIDPTLNLSTQANCGLRMQGGWNRFPEMLKKSMRLYFRGEYGDGKLRYPLFQDSGITEFDRLVLRSGNGKAWPSPWRALSGSGNSLPRTTYLRDQFVRETQRDLGHPIAHGNFVHLYVNGIYWGLYNPAERLDEKFASAHMGGDENDYDIVKWIRGLGGLQLVEGTTDAWGELTRRVRRSPSDLDNYKAVLELLDPVSLIDYMIANMYAGNIDWQNNNAYAMRNRNLENGGDGKWRFFSWDAEETFLTTSQNSTRQNVSNTATEIYSRLRASEEFRLLFADRLYHAFFNEGPLTVAAADERWMNMARIIDHAVVAESARWGDLMRRSNPYDHDDWEQEVLNIRNTYIGFERTRHRSATTLQQFTSLDLYPDIDPPLVLPLRGGSVEPGHVARLENPPDQDATIYYTVDGSDPRAMGGDVSPTARTFAGGSVPSTVIRSSDENVAGSDWKYLDSGDDLTGSAWTAPDYDDSTWPSGPSELGYGDRNENTVVSFGPDPGNKHLTTWFRHTFDLASTGASAPERVTRMRGRVRFDDGVAIYVNGTEVARFFLPQGNLTAETQALTGGDENTFVGFTIDPALLGAGTNTIAAEVHQVSRTNSDISFDLEIVADALLENAPAGIPIDQPLTIKARAFDGTQWSALQEVDFSVALPDTNGLAISEIYYAPGGDHAAEAEFIELINTGDVPIDLDGVRFSAGIAFTFSPRLLQAGERILVVRNRTVFNATFPEVPDLIIAGEFADNTALNNAGERIEIVSPGGNVLTSVTYSPTAPWPEEAKSGGYSLTWIEGSDQSTAEHWRTSVLPGGSPGTSDSLLISDFADLTSYKLLAEPSLTTSTSVFQLTLQTRPGADSAVVGFESSSDLSDWEKLEPSSSGCSRSNSVGIECVYTFETLADNDVSYLRVRLTLQE